MNWLLFVVWIIFAGIFSYLGCHHWQVAKNKSPSIRFPKRPLSDVPSTDPTDNAMILVDGSEIDQPLQGFVIDFNKYIDSYNKKNRDSNKIQAIGYWVAGGTAIFSAIITVVV